MSDEDDAHMRRPWLLRSRATIPILAAAALGVLLVLFAWRLPPFTSAVERTEDAYVRGQVTVISPKVDGYVTAVPVQDFQRVVAGQTLAQIDDRIYRQKLAQAQAQLGAQQAGLANSAQQQKSAQANVAQTAAQIASAQAALAHARADLNRTNVLIRGGWVSPQQRDQALAAERQAAATVAQTQAGREVARQAVTTSVVGREGLEAQVESARAAVQLAEIDLQNTRILAPQAGRLGEVGVRVGQYVTPGTQLMQIVPDQIWIIANMKENQMAKIRVGQPVTFRVDALNHAELKGHLERIAPAAGSEFAVLRPDNATGNFTKVAQRIPVRIAIDAGQPLAARLSPGMSVVVGIDTRRH
ncbi:HlyD family secretion protein [Phenylobacterium soli]|uniref:HlyD family secretion protein n=1 Tax=Phenylobacterium soli TaxID=2170551 RepID=A0A328A9S0_9CAUL|nr:HlyD family secretion protein [Phenylobacterium soli]RAK51127.1 HlyD family secretion protein [Phenylobacterium soli]